MIDVKKLILSVILYILVVILAFIVMIILGTFIFWESPIVVAEYILSVMFVSTDPILVRTMFLCMTTGSIVIITLFYKLDVFEMWNYISGEEDDDESYLKNGYY